MFIFIPRNKKKLLYYTYLIQYSLRFKVITPQNSSGGGSMSSIEMLTVSKTLNTGLKCHTGTQVGVKPLKLTDSGRRNRADLRVACCCGKLYVWNYWMFRQEVSMTVFVVVVGGGVLDLLVPGAVFKLNDNCIIILLLRRNRNIISTFSIFLSCAHCRNWQISLLKWIAIILRIYYCHLRI